MATPRASRRRPLNRNDPAKLEDLPGWNRNDCRCQSDHDSRRSCHRDWNSGSVAGHGARRSVDGNNPPDCRRFVQTGDQTRGRCRPRRHIQSCRIQSCRIQHYRCPNRLALPRCPGRIRDPIHERYRPPNRGLSQCREHSGCWAWDHRSDASHGHWPNCHSPNQSRRRHRAPRNPLPGLTRPGSCGCRWIRRFRPGCRARCRRHCQNQGDWRVRRTDASHCLRSG